MALDPVKNFAVVTVSQGYNDSATSIALTGGHGAKLPTAHGYNLVWWNYTDYKNPGDDPNVEIVRVTEQSTDTLTVTRAQESTVAATHNTADKVYHMMLGITAKMITDIDTARTIASAEITLAMMANLAQDKIIGRATASTGVPEAISCTAAGRAILDDAAASDQRTTLGLGTMATAAATDYVAKASYDAETILMAHEDNAPEALSVSAGTVVGRTAAGQIAALQASDLRTLLGITAAGAALIDDANAAAQLTTLGAIPVAVGTAHGDLLYFSASATPGVIAHGTDDQVLHTHSDGSAPAWGSVPAPTSVALAENSAVSLVASGSADEKWSGITVAGTAGETLAVGDLCYLDVTAGEWLLANASSPSTCCNVPLGICVLAGGNGQATNILTMGTVRSAAFPESIPLGAAVYVSTTAGDITATPPTTMGRIIRTVGHAITVEPNTILFSPDNTYEEENWALVYTGTVNPANFTIANYLGGAVAVVPNTIARRNVVAPSSMFSSKSSLTDCVIQSSVSFVGNSMTDMFQACTALVNAPTIPNSVTNMSYAFESCTNLVNAPTIGNSVTDMSYAFSSCTALVNAPTIPNSVTNMSYAFESCTNLVNAPTIGNSVTNMSGAFRDCTALVGNITVVNANVTNFTNCFYGCNASKAKNLRCPTGSASYNLAKNVCNAKNGVTVVNY